MEAGVGAPFHTKFFHLSNGREIWSSGSLWGIMSASKKSVPTPFDRFREVCDNVGKMKAIRMTWKMGNDCLLSKVR